MAAYSKLTFECEVTAAQNPAIPPAVYVWFDKEKDESFEKNEVTMKAESSKLKWIGSVEFDDPAELYGTPVVIRFVASPVAQWKVRIKADEKAVYDAKGDIQGTHTALRIRF